MKGKLTRKDFLKGILYLLFLPLLFLLNKMIKDHKRFGIANRELRHINDIPNGLSIQDEVIFFKKENALKIYSSRCTHLGCKINAIEENELVCPCHGSRYNSKGEPVKGPSVKNLKQLSFEIDKSTNELVIQL